MFADKLPNFLDFLRENGADFIEKLKLPTFEGSLINNVKQSRTVSTSRVGNYSLRASATRNSGVCSNGNVRPSTQHSQSKESTIEGVLNMNVTDMLISPHVNI